jgi:imidazolonepropionase-like amidohydrolase
VTAPAGATIVDGTGRFLVPGLWDMHVHLDGKDAEWLPLLVAHGVTSVRDLGTLREAEADSMRRAMRMRGLPSPRVLAAGFMIETPGSLAFMGRLAQLASETRHPTPRWARGHLALTRPIEATWAADSVAAARGTMLKYIDPGTPAVFDALAASAAMHGLALVGHAPQTLRTVGPWRAVDAGLRSFEHLWGFARALDTMPEPRRAELAARMRERNVAFVPTMIVSSQDAIPTDRFWSLVGDSAGRIDPRNRWVNPHERTQWAVRLGMLRDPSRPAQNMDAWQQGYERETAALRELHRLGAPVLAGSDLGMYLVYPGSSLHDELALLAKEAGMTPFEALRAATLYSARWAGMADSVGSVRQGQLADLVLLDADPLAAVANLARVRAVVTAGRLMDREGLDRVVAWKARD